MTNNEKLKNQLAKQKNTQPETIETLINRSKNELGRALPTHLNAERFTRIALTQIRINPKLKDCTPLSFMGALFTMAQMGLEPVAGRCYLIPFANKKNIDGQWKTLLEVQFVIGYKGLSDMFYRHESALSLDMQKVHENDEFDYQYGTESYLKHKPALKNRGDVIGYYAVAKMKGGASRFFFMSKEDCLEHGKKHSKTWSKKDNNFYSSSPWLTEFDGMALKTVLIQLSKLLPLSVEIQKALEVDETTREFKEGIKDALDMPDQTNWEELPEEAEIIEEAKE
jgi:recombination protein RecT